MQSLPIILLRPYFHKGFECIGLVFKKNNALNEIAKRIHGIRWNDQKASWYLTCNRADYEMIKKAFDGSAILDTEELKKYL